jgi:hypothetical protein
MWLVIFKMFFVFMTKIIKEIWNGYGFDSENEDKNIHCITTFVFQKAKYFLTQYFAHWAKLTRVTKKQLG